MRKGINQRVSWVLIGLSLVLAASLDQATRDALKVQHMLKTIEKHTPGEKGSAGVSEQEFNAYIGYRLRQEKDTLIRHLAVQMLGEDRIRGDLRLDAGRLNLGMVLSGDLVFEFVGVLVTRKGAVRLDLEALSLNGRAVEPVVLEIVLTAVSLYHGHDIGGVDDWYELPNGVDRVRVDKGRAVLFYC